MLPFLKPKQAQSTGLIVSERKPDNYKADDSGLIACANDIIQAINAKDSKALARAFRAAFEILESQPHEEAEHNDYDSMNAKAAERE